MTDPRSAATEQVPDAETVAKPKRPRRWMPMSPRSVARSLRGEKTQAIVPLREFPWAADLQAGDKVDLRAKKNAQIHSLQVEVVRACRHVAAEEIPACGHHSAEAIAPWDPKWDRVLNVARDARNPGRGAEERDQAGWVVITYIALNETRTPRKRQKPTGSRLAPSAGTPQPASPGSSPG